MIVFEKPFARSAAPAASSVMRKLHRWEYDRGDMRSRASEADVAKWYTQQT